MRSLLKPAAGLVLATALTCTGCSSDAPPPQSAPSAPRTTDSPTQTPSQSPSPSQSPPETPLPGPAYAPYVSATAASDTESAGSPSAYNLAFVIAGRGGCTPTWGDRAIDDSSVKSRISALASSGSNMRVSFGGASGKELATTCDNAPKLAKAYATALDAAGAKEADFDIEAAALSDSKSVAVRSKAIALLQKERPEVRVSFTLPVMPHGLNAKSLAVLKSANDNGVQVSTVNIMTMNYGSSFDDDMGTYAIAAAKATHKQMKGVFDLSSEAAWKGLALTSMIGVNDVDNETFTLSDAAQVRSFAEEKGVAWVSMWAAARDKACARGKSSAKGPRTDCSGIKQSSGAFAEAFSG
ncbi:chitinase [Streptomyces sporangiiformans]|uniref:Hydrolase n=1 Tax=Streptomyces sporangiiformans TaxID=2315329 RepID=A0A505DR45_9ACTN|nr:chitinase [Streptomyces sporangiiformans]TPQ23771.1 hydrolase [Streptomyces sporangiiformans]